MNRFDTIGGRANSANFLSQGDSSNDSSEAAAAEAPELLSSKDDAIQRIGVIAIASFLLFGTYIFVELLTSLENFLPVGWFAAWRDFTWPLGFGLIFSAAGVTHFAFKEAYCNIVPPRGTWGGLFDVPAPGAEVLGITYEEFHTFWTGAAEILGGLFLIAAGVGAVDVPVQIPAFLLGLLVLVVTPANVYQFTHGVEMGGNIPPIPYPWGHLNRGIAQMVLLAMFWKLTFQ